MALDFDTLASRAEKRVLKNGKRPVFEMKFGDDVISIPKPDAQVSLLFEEAKSLRSQLQILTGKDFPRVWEALKGRDSVVAQDLVSAMWDAWDDDSHSVVGGKEG